MKRRAGSTAVANWSASVLTSVSADTEPSLMITFDNAKYMFNAGENTIRSFTHSETNRKKLKAVFLSQVTPQVAGGLPGLFMTLADGSSVNELNVTGPHGLLHYLAAMRFYTYRDNLRISPQELDPNTSPSAPIFKDENVEVFAVRLSPAATAESLDTSTETSIMELDSSLKRKRSPTPEEPRKRPNTEDENGAQPSLASIMEQPDFNPTSLTGEAAQEWRRLLIRTMFPATKVPAPPDPSARANSSKGKGKNKQDAKKNPPPPPPEEPPSGPIRLPKGYHEELPPLSLTPSSRNPVGYVVIGPRVRGKFDTERATALGVPNGPLRGRLTNGQTVTFKVQEKVVGEDGKEQTVLKEVTVRPEECVGESEAPSVVIVLDVPDKTYIPSLLDQFASGLFATLRSKKDEDRKERTVKAVFHMCGNDVLGDPRYVEFMKGFADDVDHVVSSKEHCPNRVTFTSATFNQLRLNKLDAEMFPIQKFNMTPSKTLSAVEGLPPSVNLMEPNLRIGIRPHSKPAKDPHADERDLFHPLLKNKSESGDIPVNLPQETIAKFEDARSKVAVLGEGLSDASKRPGDDIVVVPLGTGSAIPGRYRTVSSTLIQIPNWGNILLDAGEGIYYQLARHFGEEGVKDILRNLKCLYVSHIHGDHHMGAAMILAKRKELNPPPTSPLFLVSLRTLQLYLQELQQLQDLDIRPVNSVEEAGNGVIPVMSEALHWKRPGQYATQGYWAVFGNEPWMDPTRSVQLAKDLCTSLGLKSIQTVDMRHGTRCYGLVLKHTEGWSLVFSGDTEQCDNLVYAGEGATLLIHEATMADDQADMARQKKHSTFGQAINIGKRMRAETILLTHFSARHPKIPMSVMDMSNSPLRNPSAIANARPKPTIALAFDQSSLRVGDMWKMKHYLPALEQNYKDTVAIDGEEEEMEGAMDVDVGA
ncbi:tRNA processing endoribonuclease [Coprinopsis sp. MPI-PUGE-AT-0042]|nr:tRNA processing endoribonuclease [Coprinopsis sp. MPI-PUGE-AT-0042]